MQRTLLRSRLAKRCEIEREEHSSTVVLGEADGIPTADYGVPAVEVLDAELGPTVGDDELELLRIRGRTPRFGREIDDRVLPPRPASSGGRSTSGRGATRGRSRSHASTTAGA